MRTAPQRRSAAAHPRGLLSTCALARRMTAAGSRHLRVCVCVCVGAWRVRERARSSRFWCASSFLPVRLHDRHVYWNPSCICNAHCAALCVYILIAYIYRTHATGNTPTPTPTIDARTRGSERSHMRFVRGNAQVAHWRRRMFIAVFTVTSLRAQQCS